MLYFLKTWSKMWLKIKEKYDSKSPLNFGWCKKKKKWTTLMRTKISFFFWVTQTSREKPWKWPVLTLKLIFLFSFNCKNKTTTACFSVDQWLSFKLPKIFDTKMVEGYRSIPQAPPWTAAAIPWIHHHHHHQLWKNSMKKLNWIWWRNYVQHLMMKWMIMELFHHTKRLFFMDPKLQLKMFEVKFHLDDCTQLQRGFQSKFQIFVETVRVREFVFSAQMIAHTL